MGNKRQRLARRNFKGNEDQIERNKAGGGSEAPQHGKTKSGKKRKVEEVNGDSHQIVAQSLGDISEEAGTAAERPSTSIEKEAISHNSAQAKDEKTSEKPGSKHPLRVPGMKPGEGCFLCKQTDHIAKLCPAKSARDRKKICLLCRVYGHTLKDCPTSLEAQEMKFCYNCGENGHRLAECKKPLKNGGTAFADCFICKQKGHLSKNCPTNPHGVYPKGGCCKLCGEVAHLAKDCPTKKAGGRLKLQISTAVAPAPELGGKRKVFKSGDDLGDDFVSDDEEGKSVAALSFCSDNEATEKILRVGTTGNTLGPLQKLNKKKFQQDIVGVMPNLVDSRKKGQTLKVVKFQRS